VKKILLVGGAGFIGHNVALKLSKEKFDVTIIDSFSVNNIEYLNNNDVKRKDLYISFIEERISKLKNSNIKIINLDARKRNELRDSIQKINPDTIIHFAGVAHANRSNKDPFTTFDNSFLTLENTLDVAKDLKCHLIYFSSSMVYGNFNNIKVTENHECNPLGIYGALKFGGEKLVIAYNQVFEMPYTIIRPSALYGQRCISGRVGQLFIENAMTEKNILINGDGKEKLDFTYIQDLIQGIKLVITKKESLGEVFNLTFGEGRSLIDLAKIVVKRFPNIQIEYANRDKLMPIRGSLSVEKAKKLLGYKPEYNIEKGFNDYITWYQER